MLHPRLDHAQFPLRLRSRMGMVAPRFHWPTKDRWMPGSSARSAWLRLVW
jgi:hypothetical protein